jgi:hypothetical protein
MKRQDNLVRTIQERILAIDTRLLKLRETGSERSKEYADLEYQLRLHKGNYYSITGQQFGTEPMDLKTYVLRKLRRRV